MSSIPNNQSSEGAAVPTDSISTFNHNNNNNSLTDLETNHPDPEMYRAETNHDNQFGSVLGASETAQSLQELGLSSTRPLPDPNYPMVRSRSRPEFPEEYTLETATGLVPVSSLRQVRSRSSVTSGSGLGKLSKLPTAQGLHTHTEESESGSTENEKKDFAPEVEFVTFVINDPENPMNWSRGKKWAITLIASFLVFMIAFGSSVPTGGLGLIEEKYNVSLEVAILVCSMMVIGFAVGPLLWSPLSEQIGRRPVYIISLTCYVCFNILCALAPDIGALLVGRFLCGVFSSSGSSLAGGTIADVWATEERGFAIAYFAAAPYCGPVVGPVVTGWITVGSGRLDLFFWVNMAFAGVVSIIMCLVPETYAPVILKRRAKRLRAETGNPNIMTEQEAENLSLRELLNTVLVRPISMMLTEPVLDLMNMYIVLIYSLLYAFFFAYPVIFGEIHGYNDGQIGLMFIPILIGALFALITTPILEKKYIKMCHRRTPTPEDRLIGAMIGAPFIPIALFILGSTSHHGIIWVGPASSGISFGYGMVLCYYSVNNYIIDAYQAYAASALAAKVFMRSGGGAAFPLFTTQMYHRLGDLWASFLLAFISTAMVIIPFGFYKYGATLREKWSHAAKEE